MNVPLSPKIRFIREEPRIDPIVSSGPSMPAPVLAYALLRLALGVCVFFHGASWLVPGGADLLPYLAAQFQGTIIPGILLPLFAAFLPFFEMTIGLLLLVGLFTPAALVLGSFEMVALLAGATLAQKFDICAQQLIYCLVYFALLTLIARNELSLDAVLRARETAS